MVDPYSPCICGSGKRVKWCCQKALPQIAKIFELAEKGEPDKALELLEKGKLEVGTPGYPACMRAHILMAAGRLGEAEELLDKTARDFPEYATPHDLLAELFIATTQLETALARLKKAVALYPPEATNHLAVCLQKIGDCQMTLGKPIAAWAAWQRANKLVPDEEEIQRRLESFRTDPLLPNFVRHGMLLRSPDELNVFNEDRRTRWDRCLSKEMEWKLEDLAETFDFLATDDRYDHGAWYNLGLVRAWLGENVRAIEALDHYVGIETDFDKAANAWDLAEILRTGDDCESVADSFDYTLIFPIVNPTEMSSRFGKCRRMAVTPRDPDPPIIHWLSQELQPQDPSGQILVKPLRRLGFVAGAEGHVIILCGSEADADETTSSFLAEFGPAVGAPQTKKRVSRLSRIDSEPMSYLPRETLDAKAAEAFTAEKYRQYYEETWLHRRLKSLNGLAPIDASQRPNDKKKLEGSLRFRERLVHALSGAGAYDFDRLRNRLGLETKRTAADDRQHRDISALPVQELIKLVPGELTDEELLLAYRTANSLDAPRTALQFGDEIVRRDSLAGKLDVAAVFRRIVNDKLEHGYKSGLIELVEKAIAYDKQHYGGEHISEFRLLEGRVQLLEGNADAACRLFKEIADKEMTNLALLASVVEKLLSAGVYKRAQEFAQLGHDRAAASRQKEFQEQFRDYLAASARRL